MRGDFSSWRDEQRQNFVGVLHQQGRVLLDADWNAQTELTNDWQDTAGMFKVNWPDSIFAMSRTVLMRPRRCLPLERMRVSASIDFSDWPP